MSASRSGHWPLACAHGTISTVDSSDLLLADGRMSYTDLGKATGLSTSAVHQRVRRLEERGVITGYQRRRRPEALGLPLTALISVTPFDPARPTTCPNGSPTSPRSRPATRWRGRRATSSRSASATPGDLEDLLARIRSAANVSTRTTVVLSTPWEGRSASATTARGQPDPAGRWRAPDAARVTAARSSGARLDVEAATPAGDVDRLEGVCRVVENRWQRALLADRGDPADDVAGAALGRGRVGHRHALDAERRGESLEVELAVDRDDADGEPLARCRRGGS